MHCFIVNIFTDHDLDGISIFESETFDQSPLPSHDVLEDHFSHSENVQADNRTFSDLDNVDPQEIAKEIPDEFLPQNPRINTADSSVQRDAAGQGILVLGHMNEELMHGGP